MVGIDPLEYLFATTENQHEKHFAFFNRTVSISPVRRDAKKMPSKIISAPDPPREKSEILGGIGSGRRECFRLNMSHAEHASTAEIVPRIRRIAEECRQAVAIWPTRRPATWNRDLKHDLALVPGDNFGIHGAMGEAAHENDVQLWFVPLR